MRSIRTLLIAGAVTTAAAVAFAAPAGAAEEEGTDGHGEAVEEVVHLAEENGATHADAECIHILAEGGTIDECREAPNPLLPETNEIIWGSIGFIVVFIALWRFGLPAVKKGLADRTERIQGQIDEADRTKAEASQILEQYKAQLADAKNESARILEEARQQADAMRRDLTQRAEADAADIRTKAQADVQTMINQARADLQNQVADLSIQLAERVVERNLDRDTNLALVENLIRELESQGS